MRSKQRQRYSKEFEKEKIVLSLVPREFLKICDYL